MQPWFAGLSGMPTPLAPPGPLFHPGVPLAPGTLVAGRYEIVQDRHESRCGFIYEVLDRSRAGERRLLKTHDPRRGDAKDEELFRREARLLEKLHHPRVPTGHGLGSHQGMLVAAQDLIEGHDLHAHVQRAGPLSEPRALELLDQVLELLGYLHGRSPAVIHRDLKPENLILDPQDEVWLVDFGTATDAPIDRRRVPLEQWTTMQTLGYAAPEQLFGLEAFPATDLYALGATMLYLLTGCHPIQLYDGMTARLVWDAEISAPLRALVEAMLVFPVAERLTSVAAARERLAAMS